MPPHQPIPQPPAAEGRMGGEKQAKLVLLKIVVVVGGVRSVEIGLPRQDLGFFFCTGPVLEDRGDVRSFAPKIRHVEDRGGSWSGIRKKVEKNVEKPPGRIQHCEGSHDRWDPSIGECEILWEMVVCFFGNKRYKPFHPVFNLLLKTGWKTVWNFRIQLFQLRFSTTRWKTRPS